VSSRHTFLKNSICFFNSESKSFLSPHDPEPTGEGQQMTVCLMYVLRSYELSQCPRADALVTELKTRTFSPSSKNRRVSLLTRSLTYISMRYIKDPSSMSRFQHPVPLRRLPSISQGLTCPFLLKSWIEN
jgi:hypothetical protein